MAIKTPGSLGILQVITEEAYGTTPDPARMKALGFMITGTADQPRELENIGMDGARRTGDSIDGTRTATLSAELTLFATQTGYDWSDIIPLALGEGMKGADDVPSASYLVKVARDEYFLMKGGVIDKLVIGADNVGAKVTAKVDVKGQILSDPTPSIADFDEDITEAEVTITPIIYNAYPVANDGTDDMTIPSHKFTYTMSNALVAQPGIVDGVAYAAGNGLVPGIMDVSLEYEVTSTGKDWDEKKMNGWKGITITHVIGGKTIRFLDCELEGGLPARSQQVYNETLTFRCHGGIEVV